MGYAARGIAPTQASLAPYPQRHLREDAMPVRAGQNRPLVARLVPPAKPVPFRQKAEIIRQTGRPVANPIAMDGDVGKPYHRGARVPSGVNAVSAISPERPAKMVARHGENDRRPRTIEHDMLPVQENMGGRPVRASEGAKGEPRGGKREHEQATSPMNEASTAPASPNTGAGAPASNQPPEKPKSAPQHGWQKEHRAPQPSPPAENGGREHGGKHQEGAAPGSAPTQAPAGNAPPEKPSPPPHRPEATPAPPAGKPPVSGPQQPHAEEKGKQPPAKEQPKGKKPEHKDKDKKEGR
jgi:hypothetical protein